MGENIVMITLIMRYAFWGFTNHKQVYIDTKLMRQVIDSMHKEETKCMASCQDVL